MSVHTPLGASPRTGYEFATLGGGCFWCIEAVFQELEGVVAVESGYSGGAVLNPSYESICSGTTGHAEVVRLEFDPARLSYRTLLEVFFAVHDATTLNRQGHDVGTQYRSVIFFHSEAQREVAATLIAQLQAQSAAQIVTELLPAPAYYRAENYHQEYFAQHPEQGYCAAVVAPKLLKFRAAFQPKLKPRV
jgi:peptide-methionine (S)-S-oxide reductase